MLQKIKNVGKDIHKCFCEKRINFYDFIVIIIVSEIISKILIRFIG